MIATQRAYTEDWPSRLRPLTIPSPPLQYQPLYPRRVSPERAGGWELRRHRPLILLSLCHALSRKPGDPEKLLLLLRLLSEVCNCGLGPLPLAGLYPKRPARPRIPRFWIDRHWVSGFSFCPIAYKLPVPRDMLLAVTAGDVPGCE